MKPTLIARTLNALLDAGNLRALYISGPPGTAKTSIPEQVAAQRGIGCIKSHVPYQQADDLLLLRQQGWLVPCRAGGGLPPHAHHRGGLAPG